MTNSNVTIQCGFKLWVGRASAQLMIEFTL